ncbi:hypothetical protein J22TS1_39730 [Siminovitchia terrae]|uniref:hypothetical protein n=1 Tax=Siminovitchia terrae TaxID=1914933 RepID=UPI001B22784F|nr:hypothetical protein [Siminovitchia terrae]GIN92922.1 hypothetical protein J22TS1_39730 [Siminovitchia terrae]
MKIKNHVIGFSLGYFACLLIIYLVTGYFSWSFMLGSLAGIVLFAVLMKLLKK